MKAISGSSGSSQFLQGSGSPVSGIPIPFADQFQAILRQIQTTLAGFVEGLNRLLPGGGGGKLIADDPAIPGVPGSNGGLIVVDQFQQLVGAFTKQVSSLLNQFNRAITQSGRPLEYHYNH